MSVYAIGIQKTLGKRVGGIEFIDTEFIVEETGNYFGWCLSCLEFNGWREAMPPMPRAINDPLTLI